MGTRGAAFLCVLLVCRAHPPWNKPGHMITAAIAYEVLKKDDPATLAKVLETLRQHPQYADRFTRLLEAIPDAEDRDLYLFMIAAALAGRRPHQSDVPPRPVALHNYPYKPPGQPETVVAKQPAEPNIVTAFAENLAIVKGDAPAADKAVALCWVFHLVGDVHQPLHAVALYTTDYPDGDRGGNRVFVRAREGGAIVNLHSLWDGLILGSQRLRDVRNVATERRLRPELAREKLTELQERDFEAWAKASFEMAQKLAYLDGKPLGSAARDENTPAVPPSYTDAAKVAAERQGVLAGYRLQQLLRDNSRILVVQPLAASPTLHIRLERFTLALVESCVYGHDGTREPISGWRHDAGAAHPKKSA